jgi:hypothetical protein
MQTEYRGYEIRFSENSDEWGCYAIGFHHEKLSKVKAKIDAMHLKLRKGAAVDCFVLECARYMGGYSLKEAKVIDYLGPIREKKSFERVGTGPVIDHEVAVMSTFSDAERLSRRTMSLSNLYVDEAQNHMAGINEIERQIATLQKELSKRKAALPCLPIEMLSDLVKASEHKFEEAAE